MPQARHKSSLMYFLFMRVCLQNHSRAIWEYTADEAVVAILYACRHDLERQTLQAMQKRDAQLGTQLLRATEQKVMALRGFEQVKAERDQLKGREQQLLRQLSGAFQRVSGLHRGM